MENDDPTVKPAWLSTEFWLTIIPTVLFLIKMFTGKDTSGFDIAGLATLAAGIATGAYAISRAIQKRAAILAKGALQQQKTAIAHENAVQLAARQHEMTMARTQSAATLVQGPDYGKKFDYIIELLERLQPADKRPAKTAPRKRTTTTRR